MRQIAGEEDCWLGRLLVRQGVAGYAAVAQAKILAATDRQKVRLREHYADHAAKH